MENNTPESASQQTVVVQVAPSSMKDKIKSEPGYGLAVASLVLGICALACICCFWLAILLGVMAIIFGAIGFKHGLGKAGTILGIIAVGVYVVAFIGGAFSDTSSESSTTREPARELTPEERKEAEAAANKMMSALGSALLDSTTQKLVDAATDVTKDLESAAEALKTTSDAMEGLEAFSNKLKAEQRAKDDAKFEKVQAEIKTYSNAVSALCGYEFGKDYVEGDKTSSWVSLTRYDVPLAEPFRHFKTATLSHTKEFRLIEIKVKGTLPANLSKEEKIKEVEAVTEMLTKKFNVPLAKEWEGLTYSYPENSLDIAASEFSMKVSASTYSDNIEITVKNRAKVRELAGAVQSLPAEDGMNAL